MATEAPTKATLDAQQAKLLLSLEEAQDPDPFVTQAEEILAKMEVDMANGMSWLAAVKNEVVKNRHVVSPIGRVRSLYRVVTGLNKSRAEAGRRAKNSPIQGISSEIGVVSGYLAYKNCYEYTKRESVASQLALFKEQFPGTTYPWISRISRLVHDATYMSTPYPLVIPQIQIGLWSATQGAATYYEDVFEFKMLAPPEVELELCAREDKAYKWDWLIGSLFKIVQSSLEDQKTLGYLDYSVAAAMKDIFWCWKNQDEREYLFENYPFLGVPLAGPVNRQILSALKEYSI